MNKTFILGSVIPLFAGLLLAACQSNGRENGNGNSLPNLAADIEAQMRQDWQEQFGYPFRFDEYLGTFNGAVVIFISGDTGDSVEKVIAGVTFSHSSSCVISVWKEGVFFALEKAYQERILTQENIVKIGNVFHPNNTTK